MKIFKYLSAVILFIGQLLLAISIVVLATILNTRHYWANGMPALGIMISMVIIYVPSLLLLLYQLTQLAKEHFRNRYRKAMVIALAIVLVQGTLLPVTVSFKDIGANIVFEAEEVDEHGHGITLVLRDNDRYEIVKGEIEAAFSMGGIYKQLGDTLKLYKEDDSGQLRSYGVIKHSAGDKVDSIKLYTGEVFLPGSPTSDSGHITASVLKIDINELSR